MEYPETAKYSFHDLKHFSLLKHDTFRIFIYIHIHDKERRKLLSKYKETLNYTYSTLKQIYTFGLFFKFFDYE